MSHADSIPTALVKPETPVNSRMTRTSFCRLPRVGTLPKYALYFNLRDSMLTPVVKGNCKFGQSCALAHVLPDGKIVNRPQRSVSTYARRSTHSSADLHLQQRIIQSPRQTDSSSYSEFARSVQRPDVNSSYYQQSHSPSAHSPYGSPHGNFPISPSHGGISALDAPLPGSFDSQGISQAARHGPFASSLPPRFGFGLESPPASFPTKVLVPISPLRDTRGMSDTSNLDGVLQGFGTSPRENEPINFAKRPLHAQRLAMSRPTLSHSLDTRPSRLGLEPTGSDDDDSEDGVGEDLLPSSLHDLLPQDKLRRYSRSAAEDMSAHSSFSPTIPQRRGFATATNSPLEGRNGGFSPIASSPSRYSAIWAARPSPTVKTDLEPNVSAFGHVGSPLRPTGLRTISAVNSASPTIGLARGTPAKAAQGSLSILTTELQRSRMMENNKQKEAQAAAAQAAPEPLEGLVASTSMLGIKTQPATVSGAKPEDEPMFSMEEDDAANGVSKSKVASSAGP